MKVLILNRYDPLNPKSGGAEIFTLEIAKRLVKDKHEVTWLSSTFKGAKQSQRHLGINIERKGSKLTTIYHAYRYYRRNKDNLDLVIDEIHGICSLTPLYVDKGQRVSLIHEVAGKIWFYMIPLPFSLTGILFEKFYLRHIYAHERFLTVSKSTQQNLVAHGVNFKNINIVSEGLKDSVRDTKLSCKKSVNPQLIYFGGIRPMKRVEDQIKAVNTLKEEFPNIKLIILGTKQSRYYEKLQKLVTKLNLNKNIVFKGFLDEFQKNRQVQQSWLNLATSVKEGWGLAVSEAGRFEIPTVSYNVEGLRDSIQNGKTGVLTSQDSVHELAKEIKNLLLDNKTRKRLGKAAKTMALKLDWDNSYKQFLKALSWPN